MTEKISWNFFEPSGLRERILGFSAVRLLFYFAILVIAIFYQVRQDVFFNLDIVVPMYVILAIAFASTFIYLELFEKLNSSSVVHEFPLLLDVVLVSSLMVMLRGSQSIFIFYYLVTIMMGTFLFGIKSGIQIAIFTSVAYGSVLIFGSTPQGQNLFLSLGLNNAAFAAVAGLSGYLISQISELSLEIRSSRKDIKALKNLNQLILENISSGLITVGRDLEIVSANKAAREILGAGNLDGRDIFSLLSQLPSKLVQGIREPMSQNREFARHVVRYDRADGKSLEIGINISPLKIEGDVPSGVILVLQDLTEIMELEQKMRRQEKLAAVGKLAAGIAHEIRNPLASISGSVELLKSTLPVTSGDEKKLMEITLREITRLNNLISEFLEYVKPDERKFELVDVDLLLNEVLDMVLLNKNLPQDVTQRRSLVSRVKVKGETNKLKQVFLNMVINAYQSMIDREHKVISVSTELIDERLVIKIQDTGLGMSEAVRKRLFEPFFTTKPKGTGLGLAVVHKILETHRADIFVESHEDKGTTFTVKFNEITKEGANR